MLRGLLDTDVARDQDLRPRAARRHRHGRRPGAGLRRARADARAARGTTRAGARRTWSRSTCRPAAILIALSAVLSLVTIISIYREGGHPQAAAGDAAASHTILTAHVLVKLLFTALTLALMVLAGRRYFPAGRDAPFVSFGLALLYCTLCIVSLGFLIASLVPTARFAQPIGTLILYPMVGLSGLVRADHRAARRRCGRRARAAADLCRVAAAEVSGAARAGWPTHGRCRRAGERSSWSAPRSRRECFGGSSAPSFFHFHSFRPGAKLAP